MFFFLFDRERGKLQLVIFLYKNNHVNCYIYYWRITHRQIKIIYLTHTYYHIKYLYKFNVYVCDIATPKQMDWFKYDFFLFEGRLIHDGS